MSCREIGILLSLFAMAFSQSPIRVFHNPGSEPFQHMVVENDGGLGNVYVGAVNHLYELDTDLNLQVNVTSDRLNEPCGSKQSVGNFNQVLAIYSKKKRLVVCNACSSCELRNLANISDEEHILRPFAPENIQGVSVAFVGPGPYRNTFSEQVLYTGSSTTKPAVASYNLDEPSPLELALPGTTMSQLPHHNEMDFVAGFSSGKYSYFMTRQGVPGPVIMKIYVPKLVRVCNADPYYHSYTEVPIICRDKNSRKKGYNLVQAVYLAKSSSDIAKDLNIFQGDDILVGVFSATSDGVANTPERGSAVCIYSMRVIEEKFMENIRKCAQGDTLSTVAHRTKGVQPCKLVNVSDKDLACGYGENNPLDGVYIIEVNSVINYESTSLTSVAATSVDSQLVILAGTSDGHLKKILVTSPEVAVEYQDTVIQANKPILPDMHFDSSRKFIYIMTQNRVSQVPLHGCSAYKTCNDCVIAQDPFCGWCTMEETFDHFKCDWCNRGASGSCTLKKECPETGQLAWLSPWKFCSHPKVSSFHPMSGPIEGGTRITIRGRNLGNRFSAIRNAVRVVDVGCRPVEELFKPGQSITCETDALGKAKNGSIVVTIKYFSTSSSDTFAYVNPFLTGFSPHNGSWLGGTIVTLEGHFLDAGSNATVTIGNVLCVVTPNRTSSRIQCKTGASKFAQTGQVTLRIDNAERYFPDEHYSYVQPPYVTSVKPSVTTMSGGILVHVSGKHFKIIQKPQLVFLYRGKKYYGPCNTSSDVEMQCLTPSVDITNSSWLSSTSPNPLDIKFAFDFDGMDSPKDLSSILGKPLGFRMYPNPKFGNIEGGRRKGDHFSIPVENMNLVPFENDVKVSIGEDYCILKVTEEELYCKSPQNQPNSVNGGDTLPEVRVMVGRNLNFTIGHLSYEEPLPQSAVIMIATLSTVAGLAFLVILVMIFATRFRLKQREAQLKELGRKLLDSCKTSTEVNRYMPIHEQLDALPYDMKFDVPYKRVKLGEMIGQGNFGLAHKGRLLMDPKSKDGLLVVVKMPRGGPKEVENFEVLIQELKMMIYAGDHINVLKLHGAVTELIKHQYCSQESLWKVLVSKQCRTNPLEVSADGYCIPRNQTLDEDGFSVFDLLSYSYQVARGMEYLAAKNLIHRDLAARNILLNGDDIIKICDFGLSRGGELYNDKRHRDPLPIKWTAIEALEKGLFTVKSDVWSYGILNWEIFSLGKMPYSELNIREVMRKVKKGYRLERPDLAPDAVYEMMMKCWAEEPEERPNFTQCKHDLALQLKYISQKSFKDLILKLSAEPRSRAPVPVDLEGFEALPVANPPTVKNRSMIKVMGATDDSLDMKPLLLTNPTYGI